MKEYYVFNCKELVRCDDTLKFNYAVAFNGSNSFICFETKWELIRYIDRLRWADCECYTELLSYERVEGNGDTDFKSNGTVLEARLIKLSQAN